MTPQAVDMRLFPLLEHLFTPSSLNIVRDKTPYSFLINVYKGILFSLSVVRNLFSSNLQTQINKIHIHKINITDIVNIF